MLSRFFIFHPLHIVPTYKATKTTVVICNKLFGREHHKDNPANAFRHALWNFLLCLEYQRVSRSIEKAMDLAEKLTDLHEMIAPNSRLAREMDLHNNEVGRNLFKQEMGGEAEVLPVLQGMIKEAVQISATEDIKKAKDKLVYLEN